MVLLDFDLNYLLESVFWHLLLSKQNLHAISMGLNIKNTYGLN